ncbi:hypothetical protein Hanom_Chr03g00236651 [Helianthus anomalus]
MQGQQYRWPHRVTTGSLAESKHMLHSQNTVEVSETDFEFLLGDVPPVQSDNGVCWKAISTAQQQKFVKIHKHIYYIIICMYIIVCV